MGGGGVSNVSSEFQLTHNLTKVAKVVFDLSEF